jgi:hypothetical protein
MRSLLALTLVVTALHGCSCEEGEPLARGEGEAVVGEGEGGAEGEGEGEARVASLVVAVGDNLSVLRRRGCVR